ncbi:hypothetical protein CDCA_CDCA18G4514 [Cyanidium caldarium]|uniref:Peptidase S54 rhomboid domain-containing protein n=1 Tax=Cyanidium caldarium TaxID=2771 RepID=A0AAV9J2E0_CYACA|nr:hypothetical protein CDCA_CDCA18G4514 [Cyanidium caldarium]
MKRALWIVSFLLLALLLTRVRGALAGSYCGYCSNQQRACDPSVPKCIPCTSSNQCTQKQRCDVTTGLCRPKGLFNPFAWYDGVLIPLTFLVAGIHNAGGSGGGTSYITLFVLLAGFQIAAASANSHAYIFAGMIANVAFNLFQLHVARNTSRIDWDLAVVTVPFFLTGSAVGVYLNQVLPGYFISLLLAAIMLLLIIYNAFFGIRITMLEMRLIRASETGALSADWRVGDAEKASAKTKRHIEEKTTEPTETEDLTRDGEITARVSAEGGSKAIPAAVPLTRVKPRRWWHWIDPKMHSRSLGELLYWESSWWHWRYWLVLAFLWSVLFVCRYLSGSRKQQSPVGMPLCGAVYWVVFAVQQTVLLGSGFWLLYRARRLEQMRIRLGYPWFVDGTGLGDLRFTNNFQIWYPLFSLIVGVFDSFTGIGGSDLLMPALYSVCHMHPFTVQSSVSAIIFVTSSAGAVQFLAYGVLDIDYSLFYGLFALLGSLTGVILVYYFAKRYNLAALLILVLVVAFAFNFGTLLYVSAVNLSNVVAAGVGWMTNSVCTPTYH